MRHRMAGFKLGRNTAHRKAMWRNMAVALFTHGQITTTVPKAKSLKPFVESLIGQAKKGDLAARRRVIARLQNPIMVKHDEDPNVELNKYGELVGGPRVVNHLFDNIAPRYADRNGGYTRIIRLTKHRIGDGADLCVLQLVGEEETGPQVHGEHSRRRKKADRRAEFAAQLRKERQGGGKKKAESKEEAPAEEASTATEEAPAAEENNEDKSE